MDREELERLYDAYAAGLFRYFLSFTRVESEGRDLLQDLFVKLGRNAGCLEGVENERAYLFRMARNLAVDSQRRGQRRRRGEAALRVEREGLFAGAVDGGDGARFREALEEALGVLPRDQRVVVVLKLWQGLTFEEVAVVESVSPNTAASRYRYGIDKLRELLRPLYREVSES
jgi:RNA polymerase sigma-70 factor (ECF subfamily)